MPSFVLYVVLVHYLPGLHLLIKGMGLDLIYHWRNFVTKNKIDKSVAWEVCNANSFYAAGFLQFCHRSPGAVNIVIGLVYEVKIEIIELQFVQRYLECFFRSFVCDILDPNLGGNK